MIKTETILRYESRMSARMYFFLFCMLTNINPNMNKLSLGNQLHESRMSARMSGAASARGLPWSHSTPHSAIVLEQHTDMFCKLHKYILQLEQIHFLLLTNTFFPCATRHHIPWLSSGNIQTLPGHVLLTLKQSPPPTYYLVIFILLLRSYLFRLIFATLHCQPLYPKFFPRLGFFGANHFVKMFGLRCQSSLPWGTL